MNQETYIEKIVEALNLTCPAVGNPGSDKKFSELPGIDSMTMVDFQMNLKTLVGDKADRVFPEFSLSIAEFAKKLEDA